MSILALNKVNYSYKNGKKVLNDVSIEFEKGKIELPLKKGDVVGNIIIKNGNNVVGKVDAVVNENIKTIGFFKLLLNNFKDIVSGNLI